MPMTPRISLRPAGAAAVLITFVAAFLTLLSVTGLTFQSGAGSTLSASSTAVVQSSIVGIQPASTAVPTSQRASVQTPERREPTASIGQGTEVHHPGGSPDVPASLIHRGWQLPADLVDLPIDASAGVIATAVSVAHRGRAPPTTGYL
jgi:hypothetical protein